MQLDTCHNEAAPSAISQCVIIEDEDGIANVISRTLSTYGLDSQRFADGMAALCAIGRDATRVVFLDVSLHNSDAIEVIRCLGRGNYAGAVQLVSGQNPNILQEIKEIGLRHGLKMRQPIMKPFRSEQIRAVIEQECLIERSNQTVRITLTEALERDWLEQWYQPKIQLSHKTIIGAEGLARVRHPEKGIIQPKSFLADASQTALAALAERSILKALSDWAVFKRENLNLQLAVNVPASALAALPVAAMIRESRPSDPDWPGLILEVTENEAIEESELLQEIATQLRLYQVLISLDDFGDGHSSLRRLRDLPFAELKLDRAFVSNCATDKRNREICQAAVELGHRLGASVVAEGIETLKDLETLAGLGFDCGQGYVFSPPVERNVLLKMALERIKVKR